MKIIPPNVSPEQALRAGYYGRLECRPYLDWLKTLPCDTCGAGAPSDPSHFNGYKGAGTKAPDSMSIPQCRRCHDIYERGPARYAPSADLVEIGDAFLERVAVYNAIWICVRDVRVAFHGDRA